MTEPWTDSYDDEFGIVRVEGSPFPNKDGVLSGSEKTLFECLRDWLFPVFNESSECEVVNDELENAYNESEAAVDSNQSAQLIADAAEMAVKADIDRALSSPEPGPKLQQRYDQIDKLPGFPLEARDAAFAQLVECDEDVMEQIQLIQEMLQRLRLRRGMIIRVVKGSGAAVGGEPGEDQFNPPK